MSANHHTTAAKVEQGKQMYRDGRQIPRDAIRASGWKLAKRGHLAARRRVKAEALRDGRELSQHEVVAAVDGCF